MRIFMRGIMAMVLSVSAIAGQSQTVQQKGVAYRYNGKHQRTPLGNVRIKAVSASNSSVSDPKSGTFTLGLNGLSMGSRIGKVRVTKQGMMIFNQDAVDEWNVRRQPLVLILCDVEEFQKQKRNLIAIGEREAKKKYDRKLSALKKKYDEKDRRLEEYQTRLDSIEEEYQNALEHIDSYADVFARIDESEVDTLSQRAIELFNRGEIEESIRLFESGDYLQKLDDAIRTGEQAREMRQMADSVESLSEKDKELAEKSLRAQISAYKLKNEWAKAGELLKGIADRLKTYSALYDYAYYCSLQTNYTEAEEYYLKAQRALEGIEDNATAANLAKTQVNMALLYCYTQRYADSEAMYKSALDTYQKLTKENPSEYNPMLALTQMNFAILYDREQRISESEEMYKSALDTYKIILQENPDADETYLALTQMNLGVLYNKKHQYAESEEMLKSALAIYQRLSQENPDAYDHYIALTQMNFAELYRETQRYSECEDMNKSALSIYQRLSQANPSVYESDYASTQLNLGLLYSSTRRYAESEEMYKSALAIYKNISPRNPAVYEPKLADIQVNLANLYYQTQRYDEGEEICKTALNIYQKLAQANPSSYESDVALAKLNLGQIYSDTRRYAESEEMFKSALAIYQRLSQENPAQYMTNLLGIKLCLIDVYFDTANYLSAYVLLDELMPWLTKTFMTAKEELADSYTTYLIKGSFYANLTSHFTEGEKWARQAMEVDATKEIANTNLAAALLMQGKTNEAEELYYQYKPQFKDAFLDDLAKMEQLGVIPEERKADVERIRKILND